MPATMAAFSGAPVRHLKQVDSTQQELYRWWQTDRALPQGATVLAEEQDTGSGRQGRSWLTAPGALATSILLRPSLSPSEIPWITAAAGIAAAESVRACGGVNVRLKWPNDLMLNGKKIGGLLAQLWDEKGDMTVALGMGINLKSDQDWFVQQGLPAASSLGAEVSGETSADAFAQILFSWLNEVYTKLCSQGSRSIFQQYVKLLADPGKKVLVRAPDGTEISGTVRRLSTDGALIVCTNKNEEIAVNAGIIEWYQNESTDN